VDGRDDSVNKLKNGFYGYVTFGRLRLGARTFRRRPFGCPTFGRGVE